MKRKKEQQTPLSLPHCKSCMITSGVEGTGQLFGSLCRESWVFKIWSFELAKKSCTAKTLRLVSSFDTKRLKQQNMQPLFWISSNSYYWHLKQCTSTLHQNIIPKNSSFTKASNEMHQNLAPPCPVLRSSSATTTPWRSRPPVRSAGLLQGVTTTFFFWAAENPAERRKKSWENMSIIMKVSSFYGCETNSKMRSFWSIGMKIKHVFET